MKVLFAGPSLANSKASLVGLECRPPVVQGGVAHAVVEGATAIGIVDGCFETTAAVWHKEILFALASGVQVLGAASMGALRAAECAEFGMVPVGLIANKYASGELDDDAAVAQLHAPSELGHSPLTETLVDVEVNLANLREKALISTSESTALMESARSLFFKLRTLEGVFEGARAIEARRRLEIWQSYELHKVFPKRNDAERLVKKLRALPNRRQEPPRGWRLARTPEFRRTLHRLRDQVAVSA
jgi:hypothetical protein